MHPVFALAALVSEHAGLLMVLAVGLVLGMSWLTQDNLVASLISLGILDATGAVNIRRIVNDAAPTQAVTALMNGQTFVGVVDAVFTLPKAVANRGLRYVFICGVASAGAGLTVNPNAADFISGYGLTAVVNKGIQDTGATDVVGDQIVVTENAAGTGWLVTDKIGTWAKIP
jgi:hypothetical protein